MALVKAGLIIAFLAIVGTSALMPLEVRKAIHRRDASCTNGMTLTECLKDVTLLEGPLTGSTLSSLNTSEEVETVCEEMRDAITCMEEQAEDCEDHGDKTRLVVYQMIQGMVEHICSEEGQDALTSETECWDTEDLEESFQECAEKVEASSLSAGVSCDVFDVIRTCSHEGVMEACDSEAAADFVEGLVYNAVKPWAQHIMNCSLSPRSRRSLRSFGAFSLPIHKKDAQRRSACSEPERHQSYSKCGEKIENLVEPYDSVREFMAEMNSTANITRACKVLANATSCIRKAAELCSDMEVLPMIRSYERGQQYLCKSSSVQLILEENSCWTKEYLQVNVTECMNRIGADIASGADLCDAIATGRNCSREAVTDLCDSNRAGNFFDNFLYRMINGTTVLPADCTLHDPPAVEQSQSTLKRMLRAMFPSW